MKCTACGKMITAGMRFCPACGTQVSGKTCPHCGAQVAEDLKFCTKCGTALEKNAPPAGGIRRCRCGDMTFSERIFCKNCGGLLYDVPAQQAVQEFENVRLQEKRGKSAGKGTLRLYANYMTLPDSTPAEVLPVPYDDLQRVPQLTGSSLTISLRDGQTYTVFPRSLRTGLERQQLVKLIEFLKERREDYFLPDA